MEKKKFLLAEQYVEMAIKYIYIYNIERDLTKRA